MLVLILCVLFFGFVIADIYTSVITGEELIIGRWYKAIKGSNKRKAITAQVDKEGLPLKYDPHYARKIEIEQDFKGQLTQCDDTNCKNCYWKANHKDIRQDTPRLQKLYDEWIEALPDGLSDELYDMMWDDFIESDEVHKEIEAKEKEDMEDYYCTPHSTIIEYQEQGYTFDKQRNSWYPPEQIGTRGLHFDAIDNHYYDEIGGYDQWKVRAAELREMLFNED
jgi:hypothetical protein